MLLMMTFFLIQGLVLFLLRQVFVSIDLYTDELSILLLLLNTLFFLFVIRGEAKSKKEFMILLSAYLIRIGALIWDVYGRDVFILPSSGIDTEVFHRYGVLFSEGADINRGGVYFRIVGIIYRLFGIQRVTAQYFNVLLSMFSIFLVKKTLVDLELSKRTRDLSLVLLSFLPFYIIMSSILLRESVIIFLITLSLYHFIKWWKTANLLNFTVAIICPLIAALFHSGSMAPTVAYVLVYLFYSPRDKQYKFTLKSIVTAGIFFGSFLVIDQLFGAGMFRQFDRINSVDDIVSVTVRGAAGYLRWMEATGTMGMIVFSPIRMFYFIASPLPWYWRGPTDIFSFFGSSAFYLSSYYLLFRTLRNKKKLNVQLLAALLMIALFATFMFAWGVNNAGTALRHRDKFIAIFVVAFAVGLESLRCNKREKTSSKEIL